MPENVSDSLVRHQCLIYRGAPSLQLPVVVKLIQQKLEQNIRCLYLNSPPMVAGLKSYLAAAGVDVDYELMRKSLITSSDRPHLIGGNNFSVDGLMDDLELTLDQALLDGYAGLWATGDMTWELGPEVGSGKLVEYEWRLERFFRTHPELGGVCQYHIDSLPGFAVRQGLSTHPKLFINDTLSTLNPHYEGSDIRVARRFDDEELDKFIDHLVCVR